ncbi:MAG: DUF433 domain-containing protein [Spirochaetes bacterium]|jgi:uncharacterized protein (DUF433 family)|nr:DUF433 domain-containing protein [Spirochaetota bacterium]
MEQNDLITANADTMLGKPVVAGTRVTVQSIVERIATGESVEEIAASHPALDKEKVLAAIGYAAKVLRLDEVQPRKRTA